MPDFEDTLLTSAFADFRNAAAPHVKPDGVAAAYATVRVRRRARTVAVTALAALFVAGPVAAYAMVNGDSHGPPDQVAVSPGRTSPAPTTGPSASPSAAPTVGAAAPDGRISTAELGRSTLELPAWAADALVDDCPSGAVKFSGASHHVRDSVSVVIRKVVQTDLDGDGAQETAAWIACGDQSSTYQVVAFDRTGKGKVRTVGQVVAQTGAVKGICDIGAGSDGSVRVKVVDYPAELQCHQPPPGYAQQQWRGYRWNGSGFVQTDGPEAFPTNKKITDLAVTTTDLTYAAPVSGVRRGSMTVTVRNLGPSRVPYRLVVDVPGDVELVSPSGCSAERFPIGVVQVSCDRPGLAPGGRASLTFEFTTRQAASSEILPEAAVQPGDGYGDSEQGNDRAEFKVRY